MINLDYRDARPIYLQICDGYRQQILSGILQQGERMPSVRELATQLTINPNTIQRAYRELELQGWVVSVPGKGSFVCGVPGDREDPAGKLLQEFDDLCARLTALGVSRQDLIRRVEEGGEDHA